ncbi:hypothetical protein ACQEVZ_01000 [Dactylosporangium sp. CA-152071]|uniref:hypothetical protein n=1 Tax=Dactylosporangium sp. CA-152071 TaxID=3239933 RepID=UPI003D949B71
MSIIRKSVVVLAAAGALTAVLATPAHAAIGPDQPGDSYQSELAQQSFTRFFPYGEHIENCQLGGDTSYVEFQYTDAATNRTVQSKLWNPGPEGNCIRWKHLDAKEDTAFYFKSCVRYWTGAQHCAPPVKGIS